MLSRLENIRFGDESGRMRFTPKGGFPNMPGQTQGCQTPEALNLPQCVTQGQVEGGDDRFEVIVSVPDTSLVPNQDPLQRCAFAAPYSRLVAVNIGSPDSPEYRDRIFACGKHGTPVGRDGLIHLDYRLPEEMPIAPQREPAPFADPVAWGIGATALLGGMVIARIILGVRAGAHANSAYLQLHNDKKIADDSAHQAKRPKDQEKPTASPFQWSDPTEGERFAATIRREEIQEMINESIRQSPPAEPKPYSTAKQAGHVAPAPERLTPYPIDYSQPGIERDLTGSLRRLLKVMIRFAQEPQDSQAIRDVLGALDRSQALVSGTERKLDQK